MTNKKVHIEGKWILAESARFIEEVDKSGKKELYLEALIVPFNKISRNGVKYNEESIKRTHQMLVGKNLMHNHVINGAEVFPRGEWVSTRLATEGLWGKAKIFQTKRNFDYIEWLENASDPRVSLQVTGDAEQRKDEEDGKYYEEAEINDWLEASTVNVPGFDCAKGKLSFTAAMAEAFGEDNTMDNSGDLVATKVTPVAPKKKDGEKSEQDEDEDEEKKEADDCDEEKSEQDDEMKEFYSQLNKTGKKNFYSELSNIHQKYI